MHKRRHDEMAIEDERRDQPAKVVAVIAHLMAMDVARQALILDTIIMGMAMIIDLSLQEGMPRDLLGQKIGMTAPHNRRREQYGDRQNGGHPAAQKGNA